MLVDEGANLLDGVMVFVEEERQEVGVCFVGTCYYSGDYWNEVTNVDSMHSCANALRGLGCGLVALHRSPMTKCVGSGLACVIN